MQGAVIAAVYFLLTYLIAPISSNLIQCRLSETMCVLPYFTPAAIPGLFIGCLFANLLMGAPVPDIVFGSLATLLAAWTTYLLARRFPSRKARWLAPLPAVVYNALIVGALLANVYEVGVSFWICALYVGIGQAIACYVAGMPLMHMLEKHSARLGLTN